MNIPEILPCPFCRKIPSGNNYHGNLSSACGHLICEHCGAEGPSAENNMESAILAWNRRQPTPEAAEVDQSIELALALGEVGASKVIAERIATVLQEVEALTEGRTDAFWAGVSMAVDEVAERLKLSAAHPPKPEPTEPEWMPTTDAAKPTERMVDEALDGFNTTPATEGLRAQVEHAVERAMWACPVFAPPSKSVWALVDKWREESGRTGIHDVLQFALMNHAIELDEALTKHVPAAPKPPAEWMREAVNEIWQTPIRIPVAERSELDLERNKQEHVSIIAKHAPKAPEGGK